MNDKYRIWWAVGIVMIAILSLAVSIKPLLAQLSMVARSFGL